MSLFKGMCALICMINKPVEQKVSLPVGSELIKSLQMPLLCWLVPKLNQRCSELIKA